MGNWHRGFTTRALQLTAVSPVLAPAAIDCYKLLSFVHFAHSLLPVNCCLYTPDDALF
jgi:hypothetical protein